MGKRYLKIITGCLSLTALAPLTACSNQKKQDEEEKAKLESIEIVSDLKDIRLELNETYSSNTIEVKCFDTNKKEIQTKTQLFLYPLIENNMDISINDNKIIIGQNKAVGVYPYKLVAASEDFEVISNIKEFKVDVYKNVVKPDSIEIKGIEEVSLDIPTNRTIDFELIAKSKGEVIQEFDPSSTWNVDITSTSSGKTKDTFNNPIFNLTQQSRNLILNISKNIDKSYEGKYTLDVKVSLLSDPTITTTKKLTLNLTYGLEYIDNENKYIYGRESIESQWCLKAIPSDSVQIAKTKVLKEIGNVAVDKIGNNFCATSAIKTLLVIDLPDHIKSIGDYAFYKQEALGAFYMQNVEMIGDSAFEGCSLGTINPQWQLKWKYICKNAFKGCKALQPVYLPDIVYMAESCFRGIMSKEIHLGNNITLIGPEALYDCPNLRNIYISATKPPQLMGDFIGGTTPLGFKIHVPTSAIDLYRNDQNWSIYSQNLVGDQNM